MKRFPIFVPVGEGHVAGVLTVPEGQPRGLVISLGGTGRHNVIGSTLCARLADRLVAEGLASVRLDYAGVGDSPGTVTSWTPSDIEAASQQARAVLTVVSEALGVSRFAAVGTCYGSRVALNLVEHPSCVGAVCLAPPILEYGGLTRLGRQLGTRPLLSFIRSNAVLHRLVVVPLRTVLKARKPTPRVVGALAHLDRARVVFLYSHKYALDHYSERVRRALEEAISTLPAELRERFELRILPTGTLTTFDVLPPEEQATVLDVVVPSVRACFEEPRQNGRGGAPVAERAEVVC